MVGLNPDILLRAYGAGLFPMAERHDDSDLYWIDPEKRGIIPLERFRIPRRFRKTLRNNSFNIKTVANKHKKETTIDALKPEIK